MTDTAKPASEPRVVVMRDDGIWMIQGIWTINAELPATTHTPQGDYQLYRRSPVAVYYRRVDE